MAYIVSNQEFIDEAYRAIRDHPGISTLEVARYTGRCKHVTEGCVKKLRDEGLIEDRFIPSRMQKKPLKNKHYWRITETI